MPFDTPNSACPNSEFVFISDANRKFPMEREGIEYISFGGNGVYSIQIRGALNGQRPSLLCNGNTFGSVYDKSQDTQYTYSKVQQNNKQNFLGIPGFGPSEQKSLESIGNENACCIRPLNVIEEKEEINVQPHIHQSFPLLPTTITKVLEEKRAEHLPHGEMANIGLNQNERLLPNWVWMIDERQKNQAHYRLARALHTNCDSFHEQMIKGYPKVTKKNALKNCDWVWIKHPPNHEFVQFTNKCYPSTDRCNTGNVLTMTVFSFSLGRDSEYFKIAFSENGIFNARKLFNDANVDWNKDITKYAIKYASMPDFYRMLPININDLPAKDATYGVQVVNSWQLASSCSSCPGHSVTISISEKTGISQKRRLNNIFHIGGAGMVELEGSVVFASAKTQFTLSLDYTRNLMKEVGESLAKGKTITIQSQCNGFYLYHFSMEISGWNGMMESVPTSYFYCTDRPTPPTCVPNLVSMPHDNIAKVNICNGYDNEHDWGEMNDEVQSAWRSFHSGRPKPLNIDPFKINKQHNYPQNVNDKDEIGKWFVDTRTSKVAPKKDALGNAIKEHGAEIVMKPLNLYMPNPKFLQNPVQSAIVHKHPQQPYDINAVRPEIKRLLHQKSSSLQKKSIPHHYRPRLNPNEIESKYEEKAEEPLQSQSTLSHPLIAQVSSNINPNTQKQQQQPIIKTITKANVVTDNNLNYDDGYYDYGYSYFDALLDPLKATSNSKKIHDKNKGIEKGKKGKKKSFRKRKKHLNVDKTNYFNHDIYGMNHGNVYKSRRLQEISINNVTNKEYSLSTICLIIGIGIMSIICIGLTIYRCIIMKQRKKRNEIGIYHDVLSKKQENNNYDDRV